uniref:Uncharacterized protein n=1 Tax=Amphimedon queenslandica TaxID=400682 RepID=A0A1X7THI9_AMPQE
MLEEERKKYGTFITDTNRLIMIIELVYSEAGEWIVQSVLDGNDLTSKSYQEKYQSYSKTRTWWMDQLIAYPTEKEMKLQRYIQSLHQDLQVAHQSKASLQEALVEANKQAKVADNEVYITEILEEKIQVEEKKQIITEEYEKLKLKVADMEEQCLMEKQIIIDLRAKVSDNELYTSKLMKEKSQLQERVASLAEQSIKETSSIGLQFNYLIPSMDKLDCLSDVQVAERKLFLIQGDKPQLMNWEKYGLRIGVQKESLLSSETVEAAVVALVGGQFQFPPNTVLVSAVYAVLLSKPLLKRLILEIQHCVDLTGQPALSHHLKFAIAPVSTPSLPYQFSILEGGEFSSNSWYGSIERKEFCLVCILGLLFVAMAGILGGGGGEGQQQQGGGVVPAQQQQGGDTLTVLAQQQQPGANEQTNGQQGEEGQEGQEQQGEHEEGQEEQGEGAEVQGEGDQPQEEEIQIGPEEGEDQSGELQGERGNQQGGEEWRELLEQGLEQQEGGIQEEGVYEEGEKDPVHNEEATPPAVACTESSSNSKHQSIYSVDNE